MKIYHRSFWGVIVGICVLAELITPTVGRAASLDQVRKETSEFLDGLVHRHRLDPLEQGYWESQPNYYVELRRLGAMVETDMVISLNGAEPGDLVSEMILVADEVSKRPESLDLLLQWYGRFQYAVPKEFLLKHLPSGAEREHLIARLDPKYPGRTFGNAAGPSIFRLRPEHATAGYRLVWEALLLASPSMETATLRKHCFTALKAIKDPRSLPILVEFFRQYIGIMPELWDRSIVGKEAIAQVLDAIGAFDVPNATYAVDALLECMSLAEAQGRLDKNNPNQFSVREEISAQLAGYIYLPHRRYEAMMKARVLEFKNDPKNRNLTTSQREMLDAAMRNAARANGEEQKASP